MMRQAGYKVGFNEAPASRGGNDPSEKGYGNQALLQ